MQKRSLIPAGFLVLLGIATGCAKPNSLNGTETGNALHTNLSGVSLAREIVTQICNANKSCHPETDVSKCQAQMNQVPGLPQSFGVPASTGITTMAELQSAEAQGSVTGSQINANTCILGIQTNVCASPGIFDPVSGTVTGLPTALVNVSACSQIY